jgi:Protein ChrB, N-terminal
MEYGEAPPVGDDTVRQWLLLIYKVPQDPTRFRTYLWRQMRMLGALSLQQMVCLLPMTPDHEREIQRLVAKIVEFRGEAHALTFASPSKEWEDGIIARFNAIVDEEYAEVVENEERFQDEIHRESRKEKFTFTELEDMEADREKINREMAKVLTRDFFGAHGRSEADAEIAKSRKLFKEFAREVYARDGVEEPVDKENGNGDPPVKSPH